MEPLREEAIHNERHLRIICIGAGASGLYLAYKIQRSFRNFELIIYEKNAGVSGTWIENTYPGCACDVPAHNYTYSFEPKHDWASVYGNAEQIQDYFHQFADKYDLHKYVKLRYQVSEARWLEESGQWKVKGENLQTGETFDDTGQIFINAGGFLNNWRWPEVSRIESFKGPLLHSAHWDHNVQLEGKNVGLIGNGASALQILPAIQHKVNTLITFIRSPTWITALFGQDQRKYTEEEKSEFATKPETLMAVRKANEGFMNSLFVAYKKGTQVQIAAKDTSTKSMKEQIKDASLHDKLIPDFAVGCRRLTPSANYIESLQKENVNIVSGEVTEFTPSGCKVDDHEFPLDVIICATGFDTSYRPRFPIIGRNGVNMQDVWGKEVEVYMGVAAAGFPNMFCLFGPHTPISNGPVLFAMETQTNYILQLFDRYQTENIKSFAPKAEAVKDFMSHTREFMQHTIWVEGCRSHYKNNSINDRIPHLWPGSTLHYVEAMKELRADDWDIRYDGNRFAWLGNGFSQTELDNTSDLAYYIRDTDDSPFASRGKRREVFSKSGSQKRREFNTIQQSNSGE